ncbi:MAG: 3-phosphoshikimate 1-carboxyvinyltransferase [Pirellulales bacterium]
MSTIEIQPVAAPPNARIRPPGSKSLTNRALVCAALARGTSTLEGVLESDDTRVMIEALGALGVPIRVDHHTHVAEVSGCGGKIPAASADLYVANSGTTVRFLTALVALAHGTFRLHGTPRMHERPIGDLLDALAQLGVRAESEAGNGCPPVVVRAAGLKRSKASMRAHVSSQFLSGLLMAAPCADGKAGAPLEIEILGSLVSKPYVEMTLAVMRAFGAKVDADRDLTRFEIAPGGYSPRRYEIEPDASAASYFWAAAAITGGRVLVEGLGRSSLQGDVAFCDCLARMGANVHEDWRGTTVEGGRLVGIDVDMNAISDTVQTLASVSLFAEGPTNIKNVAHIRHQETDRITALATELRKLGAAVEERADGLRIVPGVPRGAEIDTYDDHRMAMSLALVGLKIPGVVIRDPQCTAKTYPGFWDDLARLRRV